MKMSQSLKSRVIDLENIFDCVVEELDEKGFIFYDFNMEDEYINFIDEDGEFRVYTIAEFEVMEFESNSVDFYIRIYKKGNTYITIEDGSPTKTDYNPLNEVLESIEEFKLDGAIVNKI